ncbi:MAG: TatD family nuclease-associated radical SAM protein [Clostridiales bacterium]|jgi:TatD family-associated radical SAM protein|nr:TatD family nuclease-associated radical SAM protein [Clostridiales bacterium]
MDNFVYEIGNKLYINLTNRCSNRCNFCVRNNGASYGGYNLRLTKEPSVAEVLAAAGNPTDYKEIVFCGYGEPTYRFNAVMELAGVWKQSGVPLRINTNGQADFICGCDISAELARAVDVISISLNTGSAQKYRRICRSIYGEKAFDAILNFAKRCVKAGARVIFTVVDILPARDVEAAKQIAAACGAEFKIRELIGDNDGVNV